MFSDEELRRLSEDVMDDYVDWSTLPATPTFEASNIAENASFVVGDLEADDDDLLVEEYMRSVDCRTLNTPQPWYTSPAASQARSDSPQLTCQTSFYGGDVEADDEALVAACIRSVGDRILNTPPPQPVEQHPSTSRVEPVPSTSREEPMQSTSREEPMLSTSREEPQPSSSTDVSGKYIYRKELIDNIALIQRNYFSLQ